MMARTIAEEYDLSLCVDCLTLIANGEVWGTDGEDIAEAHNALIDAQWPEADGWHVTYTCPEDCDGGFSWSPCDGCGSRLGGDRHPGQAWRYTDGEL